MKRLSIKKIRPVALVAVVLVAGMLLGFGVKNTMAWLVDSDEAVNTFTYGDVDVELEEKEGDKYKIIPGHDITKDPMITVKKNSEDCYVFVKLEENDWPVFDQGSAATYEIADGWTKYEDVYYRIVDKSLDQDQTFQVIKDNKIEVKDWLTKEQIKELGESNTTLTVKAYAVQKIKDADGTILTVAEAYDAMMK